MALEKQMRTDVVEGVTVISFGSTATTLHGKLVDEMEPTLLAAARGARNRLLVDLDHVDFFNSTLIELLVRCWKIVRGTPRGQFALCNLQPYCREVLEVTNLTHVWPIFPDRATALAALKNQDAATSV